MPVDMKRYPPNWREISQYIRFERAGGKCERCGVEHGVWGQRDPDGRFWTLDELETAIATGRLEGVDDGSTGGWSKPFKIILTTAHIGAPFPDGTPGDKHDKMDVRPENLLALCQRCHLLEDLPDHMKNAAATRRRRKVESGQLELF